MKTWRSTVLEKKLCLLTIAETREGSVRKVRIQAEDPDSDINLIESEDGSYVLYVKKILSPNKSFPDVNTK
jgi:hypothetical protein